MSQNQNVKRCLFEKEEEEEEMSPLAWEIEVNSPIATSTQIHEGAIHFPTLPSQPLEESHSTWLQWNTEMETKIEDCTLSSTWDPFRSSTPDEKECQISPFSSLNESEEEQKEQRENISPFSSFNESDLSS